MFASPTGPGLSVVSVGRGCNASYGRFVIRELLFALGTHELQRLAVDFEQYCDGQPEPLRGALRFHSSIPPIVTEPTAVAGRDQDVLERSEVTLDGRHTMNGAGTIDRWEWRQTSGPAVSLTGADTSVARFAAPKNASATETRTFQLRVTSNNGTQDTDSVSVTTRSKSLPRTEAWLDSGPNEFIGLGQSFHLLPADGNFTSYDVSTAGELIHIVWAGIGDDWQFDFGQNVRMLRAGHYEVDTSRNLSPSMLISAGSRGCNHTRGTFDIQDIAFTGSHLERLAVKFLQYCDSFATPLKGRLLYSAQAPDANAGPSQSVPGRARVTLSAADSVATVGELRRYSWTQLSGPAVALTGGDTPAAAFTAPDLAPGTAVTDITMELTVTDDRGVEDSDTVVIAVSPAATEPPPPGGGSSGAGGGDGSLSSFELLTLSLLCFRLLAARTRCQPLRDRRAISDSPVSPPPQVRHIGICDLSRRSDDDSRKG